MITLKKQPTNETAIDDKEKQKRKTLFTNYFLRYVRMIKRLKNFTIKKKKNENIFTIIEKFFEYDMIEAQKNIFHYLIRVVR